MKLRKLQLEELLPVLLALTGIIGITPFVFVRMMQQDWIVALLDSVIVVSLAAIAWSVYRYRAVRLASTLMALLCITGVVLTIYARGASQMVWTYPGLVAMFYLLRPLEAVIVSLIAVGAVTPILLNDLASSQVAVTFASLFVTLALSGAFAAMTSGQRRQLRSLSLADPLTGVGNRRALDEAMPTVIAQARRSDAPVSLVMIDLDHFKRINDEYGHATGDKVLVAVSEQIRKNIRTLDGLYRVGGEEFVVLAIGSGIDLAHRLGEELLGEIARLRFSVKDPGKPTFTVTVSVGVAELLDIESADNWYRRADDALYEAKRSGRNRVCIADKAVSISGTATFATG